MILVGVVLSDTDCAGLRTLFDSSGLFFDFLSRLALKQQRLTQRVLLPRFKIKGGTCRLVQIIFYQKTNLSRQTTIFGHILHILRRTHSYP